MVEHLTSQKGEGRGLGVRVLVMTVYYIVTKGVNESNYSSLISKIREFDLKLIDSSSSLNITIPDSNYSLA